MLLEAAKSRCSTSTVFYGADLNKHQVRNGFPVLLLMALRIQGGARPVSPGATGDYNPNPEPSASHAIIKLIQTHSNLILISLCFIYTIF